MEEKTKEDRQTQLNELYLGSDPDDKDNMRAIYYQMKTDFKNLTDKLEEIDEKNEWSALETDLMAAVKKIGRRGNGRR